MVKLWTKIKLLFRRHKLVEHTISDATLRVPFVGSLLCYYDSISDVLYVPEHQYFADRFLDKTEDILNG